MYELEDHGLPLVALKEQRRELVVSLAGCGGPFNIGVIRDLAAIQSAIDAIECVIADLDQEQNESQGVPIKKPLSAN